MDQAARFRQRLGDGAGGRRFQNFSVQLVDGLNAQGVCLKKFGARNRSSTPRIPMGAEALDDASPHDAGKSAVFHRRVKRQSR